MRRPLFALALLASSFLAAAEPRTEIARQPMPRLMPSAPRTGPEDNNAAASITPISSTEAGSEFGEQVVLVRNATWDPWRVDADVDGFFTDNVALAPKRVQDFFLKYGVNASYTNRISGPWSMDVTLGQDLVRYDKFNSLDFDFTHASTGIAYQAAWLADATMVLRYNFYRLTAAGFGDELMNSHTLSIGLQKVWKLGSGSQLFLGASSDPSLATEPAIVTRHEHAVFAGWQLRVTDRLTTQVTGRVGYNVSPNSDRNDWNYIGLVSATYALTDWAKLGVSGSIAWNESSREIFTYRNVMAGVYLGLQLSF